MRILFISASPLKKEISIGNTFLNLFSGVENVEIASIYTRAGKPDTSVSQSFCITEKMLIKNLLRKGCAGERVERTPAEKNAKVTAKDSKSVSFAKKHRWTVLFWLQALIWRIGRWQTQELRDFIKDFQPDIVFTVLSSTTFLNRLILHVQDVAKVPLVLYAWDDNYSMKRIMLSPLRWIHHFINRKMMRKVVKKADLLYTISEVQKNDYEKAFHRECKVLTKGADFSGEPKISVEHNKPLQLIYTGNIGLNRWKSLAHIANVLEKINQDGIKAQLRIYSGNALDGRMRKALNRGESSCFMGSVSADAVAALQASADILVHVEPTDLKNKLSFRQSFSTKLVDYFHQAKAILAYGPKDVASIAHLIMHEAAIWAEDEGALETKIRELCAQPKQLNVYAIRAWECGKNNHCREAQQRMLLGDIEVVMQREK